MTITLRGGSTSNTLPVTLDPGDLVVFCSPATGAGLTVSGGGVTWVGYATGSVTAWIGYNAAGGASGSLTTNSLSSVWIGVFAGCQLAAPPYAYADGPNMQYPSTSPTFSQMAGDLVLALPSNCTVTSLNLGETLEFVGGASGVSVPAWAIAGSTSSSQYINVAHNGTGYGSISGIVLSPAPVSSPSPPRVYSQAVQRAANWFKRETGLWSPESGLIPRAA